MLPEWHQWFIHLPQRAYLSGWMNPCFPQWKTKRFWRNYYWIFTHFDESLYWYQFTIKVKIPVLFVIYMYMNTGVSTHWLAWEIRLIQKALDHSNISSHLPETIKILCTVCYHHIFSKTGAQNVDTMHWCREQHWSIRFPELVGAHFLMRIWSVQSQKTLHYIVV